MRVDVSSKDYESVREIQGWRGDVEDCCYGLDAGDCDEDHGAAECNSEPDGVDGGVCFMVDLGEESRGVVC